jgi:FKBP-type peptidyl-prolyl cis-trans isomerase
VALLFTGRALAAQAAPPIDAPAWLAGVTFAEMLQVDLARSTRLHSGVYQRDLRIGVGDSIRTAATVTLRFDTRLPDGTQLDSSAAPITVRWRRGMFLPGVEQGLYGMRAGGRRQLVVPGTLAFGDRVVTGIPAGTPVVVKVELLTVGGT